MAITMTRSLSVVLAAAICAAPILARPLLAQTNLAQANRPADSGSGPPPGTTLPPVGHPATGDPAKPLPPEPANAIDSGATPRANALTERQARDRLEQNGYREVAALAKSNDGIWRGSATKDGAQVRVSVDVTGNISSN